MSQHLKPFLFAAALIAGFGSMPVSAGQASNQPKMFGIGQPASIEELPPGPIRDRLESLTPSARDRALEWLQGLEFPAADLEAMQIDDQGGVLFVEPMPPLPLPDAEQN